ncbi:MAG TPA: hypothetical protein VF064_16335 [Pyrinomonadaceae bacterium]
MGQKYQVRIIKRGQRESAESVVEAATPERAERAEPSERELKTVMSGWVREHRQRTEEYRRSFAGLLRQVGFNPLPAGRRS